MLTENSFARLSDEIIEVAERVTLSILERLQKIARLLAENPEANINREAIRKEVEKLWEQYFTEARQWTDESLPEAYLKGIERANNETPDLEATFGFRPEPLILLAAGFSAGGGTISGKAAEILKDYPKHHTMYTAFQDAAYSEFQKTRLPVVRDVRGKLRDLVVMASEDAYKDADGFTRRKMTQRLMNKFADDNITGIQYSDGRTMKLDTYSEMVARSQTGNASRQAAINRQQQYGIDLTLISQHYPTSDLCRPYQGRVFSISGTSAKYPPLSEALAGGLYHANSYIKDMELYTKNGWKLFKELDGSEQVLSLNPDTHIPEWCGISELHEHESEKMIQFTSNSFDLCVTPDHDLYIGTPRRNKGEGRTNKYKFEKAEKAIERGFFSQLRCVNWEGEEKEPPISGITKEQFAKLLAWYISDGSCEKPNGKWSKVRISKQKEPHKSLLEKELLPMGFKFYTNGFVIYNSEWAEYFAQFGKSYEKFLPDWILQSTPEIIRTFLDAYIIGDGSKRTNNYKGHDFESVTYFTTSTRLAEQLGECIIKAGYYPSFSIQKSKGVAVEHHNGTYVGNHDTWRISRNTIKESYYLNSPSNKHKGISAETIDYNDTAYCVTLEKNHIMWVRRNGKTTWSGNCKHFQSEYIEGTSIIPEKEMDAKENREKYQIEQRQRQIERNIRKYKRREAVAITDSERERAKSYVRKWQKENRQLVDEHSFLRRKYARESV